MRHHGILYSEGSRWNLGRTVICSYCSSPPQCERLNSTLKRDAAASWRIVIYHSGSFLSSAAFHVIGPVACHILVRVFERSSQRSSSSWLVTENFEGDYWAEYSKDTYSTNSMIGCVFNSFVMSHFSFCCRYSAFISFTHSPGFVAISQHGSC
jgi:hypothetical protein